MAGDKYDHIFKILIIGDSGVGKTSILKQFSEHTFNFTPASTIGRDVAFKRMEVKGKKIKLHIWDTAGQERFDAVQRSYYRDMNGIMVVYDVIKPMTFDHVWQKWLSEIEKYATNNPNIMVLGNRCDKDKERLIIKEQGEQMAEMHGVKFFETSAKEDINIDEAFLTLVKDILKNGPLSNTYAQGQIREETKDDFETPVSKKKSWCC